MNTKKGVFLIGITGSILLFLPAVLNKISPCNESNWFFCSDSYEILAFFVLPLFPIFFLSLITYRMKDEIFRAWWNFARWWVLVIIVVTLILNNLSGGGTIGMDKDFTAFILIILYSILILDSLAKITRTYLRLRWEEKGISEQEQIKLKKTTTIYITVAIVIVMAFLIIFT